MGKPYSQDLRERVIATGRFWNARLCGGAAFPGQCIVRVQGCWPSAREW